MSDAVDGPVWPPGNREMARLIRVCDWAATPLGDVESWSARLRLMVEQLLVSPHVSALICGPDRILIYNDAAALLYGGRHPTALGRPLPQTFPEGWATMAPFYARAFAGESVQVTSQPLDTRGEGNPTADVVNVILIPVREEDGRIAYVHMTGMEVGQRAPAKAASHDTSKRQGEELAATRLLQQFSTTLIPAQAQEAIYDDLMNVMMALMHSQTASVQTFDPRSGTLTLIAYRGYAAESAAYWETLDASSGTVCGLALKANKRMLIRDVECHAPLAGTRHLEEYRRCGLRGMQSTPLLARDGRPLGMISTCWREPHEPREEELRHFDVLARQTADLLDRAQAEAALRQSEQRLRTVLSMHTVGVLFWGEDFRLTETNGAFLQMTCCKQDEVLGKGWQELTPPEFHPASENAVAELKAHGEITPYEKQYFRCDGSRFWGLFAMRSLGRGAVEFVLDVSDRKSAEAALREEEARQRTLIEGIPQLVWRAGEGGRWIWASPQWCAYTGQSETQSREWGWLDALHPDDREAARDAWRKAKAAGMLQMDSRIRQAESGRYSWFQTHGRPVYGAGRIIEWIGACANIDDQMQARQVLARAGEELEARVVERTAALMAAEEKLRQFQKMEAVGQLTGGIAHDFNNMLQGMAGAVEMARRRITEDRAGEARRYLDAARDAMDRAAGLTRRLLAFSRRQRLEPKPVEADGLVAGLADLIRRTVGPAIAVELRLSGSARSVLCDPNEMESALLNLCINARDAMPDGGQLAIRTEEVRLSAKDIPDAEAAPGPYVEISVADTGTGIPPEMLARVFEPFFTTKPQGQGTGLGLSQVYGFVRQSDGLVRIQSTPARGTTVRLLLPLHKGAPARAEAPGLPASSLAEARGTVLLVDDEDAVRGPAADRLRELSLTVLEARNGPEALRVLASSARPDLLVTDVGLPKGMNGRQLAEAVRARVAGVPVLFITGYAGTMLPPGVEVINKPFELDALARRVQAILNKGRRHPDST